MVRALLLTLALAVGLLPGLAGADELTAIIQKDLQTLGYEPGSTDGEATVQTAVAISKFQAENDMDVTGEASPQLAGVIKAAISKQGQAAPAAPPAAAQQQAQAAQQACLQQKIAAAREAQESAQRRRGFGSLVRGLSRLGGNDAMTSVVEATADIANANAAISDLESAARDLGLTEEDVAACGMPQ